MKYLIIFTAVLILIFAGAAAWVFWPAAEAPGGVQLPSGNSGVPNYQSTVTTNTNNTTGSVESGEVAAQTYLTVPTSDGGTLQVNSFMSSTTETIGGEVFLAGSRGGIDRYRVSFYLPLQTFAVLLLAEPLKETRELGEQELMRKLGISEADACRLVYFVSLPEEVNPIYAGINLGFSFCPGAVQL